MPARNERGAFTTFPFHGLGESWCLVNLEIYQYHFHSISEVFRSFSVLEPRALEEWPRSPLEPCL